MRLDTAIAALRPGAVWVLNNNDYSKLVWLDKNQMQPTEKEITAYISANSYTELRTKEYPPLADLADALVHNDMGDPIPLRAYYTACEAVKAKYPKPV